MMAMEVSYSNRDVFFAFAMEFSFYRKGRMFDDLRFSSSQSIYLSAYINAKVVLSLKANV